MPGTNEVGIRERTPTLTLCEFAERDFLPFVRSTFAAKLKTRTYYESGLKSLLAYGTLASFRLDAITTETMSGFAAKRREQGLEISSINRELQVLRRMFSLAQEWGKVEKALPRVRMIPGERHRERVLTVDEETRYLNAAREWDMTADAQPLLPDVATVLLDCGLRPEECFRLQWPNVRADVIEIE